MQFTDAQTLSFVQGQAYTINQRVYETRFPDFDYGRLIYVNSEGPEWAPGVMTYSSDMSGQAKWQSGYAKDVPLADVSQNMTTRQFRLAAIGYQYNIEEINSTMGFPGANLPDRRARAARMAYFQFMYDLTLVGDAEKGLGGLINYPGVTATTAPADGTGGVTYWVDSSGVGTKTPAQIVRDINIALSGVNLQTNRIALADTLLLPQEALDYISATPYSATTMETILSFVTRNNRYTLETGRPLTIRSIRALSTGATGGTTGRMVAYRNDPNEVQLHLPMPHRFLPVYQDGPLNYAVPGIFRTGGVEVMSVDAFRYVDGISQPAA
jgi:hypothetical protein